MQLSREASTNNIIDRGIWRKYRRWHITEQERGEFCRVYKDSFRPRSELVDSQKQEMTALANEKERQKAALRQRCMRRKAMSPCDDAPFDESVDILQQSKGFSSEADLTCVEAHKTTPNEGFHKADDGCVVSPRANALRDSSTHSITRESLEAAARASLRTKFDHVGTDPHSFPDRDTSAFVENRAMTNSPPPPRLLLSTAPSNIVLSNHVGASGLVRQQASVQNSDYDSTSRVRSPILFQQTDKPANRATTNSQPANHLQILQLHHAVALAGVSIGTQPVPFLEQTAIDHEGYVPVRQHGGLVEGGDADVSPSMWACSNKKIVMSHISVMHLGRTRPFICFEFRC